MSVVRVTTRRCDGVRLATKCIAKEPLNLEDEEALMQEVNVLQQLDHPNIVKLLDTRVGRTGEDLYLVLEYMEQTLRAVLHGQPPQPARDFNILDRGGNDVS